MQRSVLVVDDERNMLTVMEFALKDAGYRVLTAERAEEALEFVQDPDLDVILSDLKMPGMGGQEFIRRARQLRPDVPIIVVTAYGSIRSAIECVHSVSRDIKTRNRIEPIRRIRHQGDHRQRPRAQGKTTDSR